MTKKALLEKLRELAREGDTEHAHREADLALIEFIGDIEIAQAFDDMEKWYG